MKRATPYVVFIAAYAGLLLLAGFAALSFDSTALDFISTWVAPLVVAPLALLLAMRLGRPSSVGIAVSSLAFATGVCVATVGVFIVIAIPTGELTVPQAFGMFPTYFSIGGGWMLLLSYLLVIGAPVLWSAFLLRPRIATRSA